MSNQTKHTDGNWEIEKQNHRMRVVAREPQPNWRTEAEVAAGTMRYSCKQVTPDWRERKTGARRGCSPTWLGFDAEEEANARLIAAAPELLEACKMIVLKLSTVGLRHSDECMRHSCDHPEEHRCFCGFEKAFETVAAAISRAEGKQ